MSKSKTRTGYDHSRGPVAPYSANSRTGERISTPAKFDPRNRAAEKQQNSRAGAGYREMNADQASRKAARQGRLQQQERDKLKVRGSH